MDNNGKTSEKITKWLLIGISVIFLAVMLLLPLITVITEALRSGWKVYVAAVTDEYTIKALLLTVKATLFAVIFNTIFGIFAAWALTKFQFKGKKLLTTLIDLPVTISPVIAGLIFLLIFGRQSPVYFFLLKFGIKVVFSVPGIIIATVFVTFPFISRELIQVLEAEGTDEEEAAALMGAGGWTIFWKITFPHIKWALLYGIVLCTARAMGEFGAVSVLSGHLRGKTNTLPLVCRVKKYKQDLWFLPGIKECEFRYRKRQADRPAGTKWKRKNNHSSNDCRSGNSGQRRDHY